MKVRVPRDDAFDAVLTHEYGGVGIMQQIAAQLWQLGKYFPQGVSVTLGGQQDIEGGRGPYRVQKSPGVADRPGFSEHAGVGTHAQEFIADAPGQIPGRCLPPPALKPCPAGFVKFGILISSVNQDIGINHEHSAFVHGLKQRVPISNIHTVAAAAELGEFRQLRFRPGAFGLKQQAQPGLDQLGHGTLLTRGLAP